MQFRIYADHLQDTQVKFCMTLLAVLVLAIMLAVLGGYTIYAAEKTRIVVVPTHLKAKLEIEGEASSPEYIRIMGIHLTNLLYSYTPFNITERYKEFLAYVPAEQWNTVKSMLQQRIDQVGKLKISESFMLKEFTLLKDNAFLVAGNTIRWASGQELTTDEIIIRYNYTINDGGLMVDAIRILSHTEYTALLHQLTQ